MLNALGLGFLFTAKDEASEAIEKIHKNLDGLKGMGEDAAGSIAASVGTAGKYIAGTFAVVGALAAGTTFELAEHAEHFSGAILNAGIAAHSTKEELEGLEEFARNKALDSLGKSAIGVAETLQELAREGFTAKESMQAVDATMDLMRFTSLDARDAASLVHDTIAEFGMTAGQSGDMVDKLAFAMREFHFRAEELRPVMAGLASGAHLVNASFDDTLIGVGILKDAFPNATKAGMAMNLALQQLASKPAQKELASIGVTVRDTTGHIRPLLEVLQDLSTKTARYSDAQLANKLASIGSARAAGGLSVIIDQLRKGTHDTNGNLVTGAAALDVYRNKLNDTNGTASKLVDMLGDSFGGAFLKLKNAISNLEEELGKNFEEPWKRAFATANLFVRGLTQLFTEGGFSGEIKDALDKTENQGLKGFLIGVFVWVERIKNFFSGLGDAFSKTFEPFMPIVDMLLQTFHDLGQALGIVGQTADENAEVWDSFGGAGATVGSILANLAGSVLPFLIGAVQLVTGAVEIMRVAWSAIGPIVGTVGKILTGVFEVVAGLFTGSWKKLWDGFIDIVSGAGMAVVRIITGALGIVAKLIDGVGSAFGKDFGLNAGLEKFSADQAIAAQSNGFTADNMKAWVGPDKAPAVAAQAAQIAAVQVAQPAMSGATAEQEQHIHVHTAVHLDGEKIGAGIAKAKRSSAARGFESVQPEPAF